MAGPENHRTRISRTLLVLLAEQGTDKLFVATFAGMIENCDREVHESARILTHQTIVKSTKLQLLVRICSPTSRLHCPTSILIDTVILYGPFFSFLVFALFCALSPRPANVLPKYARLTSGPSGDGEARRYREGIHFRDEG